MKRNAMAGDIVNLLLAIWLFLSPWIVGFAGTAPAAWTAWLSAIAVAVFAIAALSTFAVWEEWVTLILGVWLLISPWIVGVSANQHAAAALSVTGIVVGIISLIDLWSAHQPPRMTTA